MTKPRPWHKATENPPDIPEDENFGVDYQVKCFNPESGAVETFETEWLWEKEWNCIYPIIAWRETADNIIEFPANSCEDIERD